LSGRRCPCDAPEHDATDRNQRDARKRDDTADRQLFNGQELIDGRPPAFVELIENTRPVTEFAVADFDCPVVTGGQSPMFAFADATALHTKFTEFYEAGKVTAALCHGVAILSIGDALQRRTARAGGVDPDIGR
jgi:putative intracellular protease/amidase